MPYNNRKKYTRPGYRACGKMVLSDARKALVIARGVKRLLNVEVKNFDVQLDGLTVTDGFAITQLSNIPQGDTTNERDGAQVKMVGFEMSYFITRNVSADASIIRILLVIDKQTNQAIFVPGDMFEDSTVLDNLVSPRNLDNKHRFTVLYDRVHHLSNGGPTSLSVKKYFKKDLLLRYDGSTPSIADLTQNSLAFMRAANQVTNDPIIRAFFRLRFVDN